MDSRLSSTVCTGHTQKPFGSTSGVAQPRSLLLAFVPQGPSRRKALFFMSSRGRCLRASARTLQGQAGNRDWLVGRLADRIRTPVPHALGEGPRVLPRSRLSSVSRPQLPTTPRMGPRLLQSPPRGNVQKEIRFSDKAAGSLTLKLFNFSPEFLSFFTNLIPLPPRTGWETQPQGCGSFGAGGRSGPSAPDATSEGCLSLSARPQGPAGRGVARDHCPALPV